ncbi:TPA: hypothetical protein N0F65_002794 [Lagenidium giganteum]|uniref:Uncharacterized protein n=1 Tax=Lagenidium giganteum TaxID=4803 RepID=A0AAV2YJ73_9STRA|nr:TPA: hypothetical protein N0F65_002794 [Lagenidium giganteum]
MFGLLYIDSQSDAAHEFVILDQHCRLNDLLSNGIGIQTDAAGKTLVQEVELLFASFQFTELAVCICDAFYWDDRAASVGAHWVWYHWVYLLDARTPDARSHLAIHKIHAVVMLLVLFATMRLTLPGFISSNVVQLQNRVLFDGTGAGAVVRIEILSFVSGRIPMLLFWGSRLLWRVVFRPVEAFRVIEGTAQYALPSELASHCGVKAVNTSGDFGAAQCCHFICDFEYVFTMFGFKTNSHANVLCSILCRGGGGSQSHQEREAAKTAKRAGGMLRVAPSDDVQSVTRSIYEIVAHSASLRTVDLNKTPMAVWVGTAAHERWLQRFAVFHPRASRAFLVGIILSATILFVRPRIGRVLAPFVFALCVPGLCSAFSFLTVDMMKHVMRTYEFWFLTVLNLFNHVIMALMVEDLRVLQVWVQWMSFQKALFIDANARTRKSEIHGTYASGPLLTTIMICSLLGLIYFDSHTDFDHGFVLLGQRYRLDDLLSNGIGIQVFFLVARLVRVYQAKRRSHAEHLTDDTTKVVQLDLAILRACAHCCGLLFCGYTASYFHPQLLKMLVQEVDLLFASFQFTVLAVCICDAFYWDDRAASVGALWIHAVVVLLVLFATMLLVLRNFIWSDGANDLHIQNRVLFDGTVAGAVVHIEMLSFVSGRIPMLLFWGSRLLWRVVFRPVEAFRVIEGTAQYALPSVLLDVSVLASHRARERRESRQRRSPVHPSTVAIGE